MVVGEKFVFYEAYEEVGVARSHFGSHCNTVDLFVVVVVVKARRLQSLAVPEKRRVSCGF